jgi:hypothetical protein
MTSNFILFHPTHNFAEDIDPAADLDLKIYEMPLAAGTLAKVDDAAPGADAKSIDLTALAETEIQLPYAAAQKFVPSRVVVTCTSVMDGDAEIKIGSSSGGGDVLAATALTGLTVVGKHFSISLSGVLPSILGSGKLFLTVTSVDSHADAAATVRVEGSII